MLYLTDFIPYPLPILPNSLSMYLYITSKICFNFILIC